PHRTGDDNAQRAVEAALHVQSSLESIGLDSGIGVATGKVFCGPVGSPRRREYTIHGGTMNLSARLMQAATDEVLCDEATMNAVRGKLQFQELPRYLLK